MSWAAVSDAALARASELVRASDLDLPTDGGEIDHLAHLIREWPDVISAMDSGGELDRAWLASVAPALIGACHRQMREKSLIADAIAAGPVELAYARRFAVEGTEGDVADLARLAWFTASKEFSTADAAALVTLLQRACIWQLDHVAGVPHQHAAAVIEIARQRRGAQKAAAKAGAAAANEAKKARASEKQVKVRWRFNALVHGGRDVNEAIEEMVEGGFGARSTLYRWLAADIAKYRKPVNR